MKLKFALSLSLLWLSTHSQAMNVGEITSFIFSSNDVISKQVSNPSDTARLVALSVKRIRTPMQEGGEIPFETESEILSTPASMILPSGAKDNFRIFYQGPRDDQERYYRLAWIDQPVSEMSTTTNKKSAVATTSAEINTLLVVAPRQEKFDYAREKNIIYNRGNVSFRVVAVGKCVDPKRDVDGKGCRERYYVMPQSSAVISNVDLSQSKYQLGIWHKQQYIVVK